MQKFESGSLLTGFVSNFIVKRKRRLERLEKVERELLEFSPEELATFRQWLAAFDADAWDRQFDADVKAGKLDPLAERAVRDHAADKSTNL